MHTSSAFSSTDTRSRSFDDPVSIPGSDRPASPPVASDRWPTFWAAVSAVFPTICPDHARQSAPNHNWNAEDFIAHILDQQEAGHSYPTKSRTQKRKRTDEDDEADLDHQIKKQRNLFDQKKLARMAKGYRYMNTYLKATSYLLQIAFPEVYVKDIEATFRGNQVSLHHAYVALKTELSRPEKERGLKIKKSTTKLVASPDNVHNIAKASALVDNDTKRRAEEEALAEYKAIHNLYLAKEKQEADREAAKIAEAERERLNEMQAIAEGSMGQCQCCFVDYPMNRMVYCTSDTPHYVCYECATNYAKSQVGMSRWEIKCFAEEGCQGTYSHAHRAKFLDENLSKALDRLEQEHVLEQSGMNLAQCPFCPYAAEYPPVEVNKEFTCESPDCGAVTCRLCRALTHIPKSCEEIKSENAAESARHQIEEDMTLALIRKCNKCKTAYLKENGCNKIVCSKCSTYQCYICQQTIQDYQHFRDPKSACYGRLHDNVESQSTLEVEKAEKAAREKILKENAHIQENHLGFKFSTTVQKEEEARRAKALAAEAEAAARRRELHAPPVIPPELLGGGFEVPVVAGGRPANLEGPVDPMNLNHARLAAHAGGLPPPMLQPLPLPVVQQQQGQRPQQPQLQDFQQWQAQRLQQQQAQRLHQRLQQQIQQILQHQPQQILQQQPQQILQQQPQQAQQQQAQVVMPNQRAQHQAQEQFLLARQQAQQYAQIQAQRQAQEQARLAHQAREQARQQARAAQQQAWQAQQQAHQQARQPQQARAAGAFPNPTIQGPLGWPQYMTNAVELVAPPQIPPAQMAGVHYELPGAQDVPAPQYHEDGLPRFDMAVPPMPGLVPQAVIDLTGDGAQEIPQAHQQAAGFGHNIPADMMADWGF